MQTYSNIQEAVSTTRVGLDHLEKLKPIQFLSLMNTINKKYNGILSREKISITEKIDGGLRFGQDESGRPFIETSRSGPRFKSGTFLKYVKSRGKTPNDRTYGYEKLLLAFKRDASINALLSKYNDGNGVKIVGEIMYVPFAVQNGNSIRFVTVDYDKKNLGTEWTFVALDVLYTVNNNRHKRKDRILKELYALSNSARKYISPSIPFYGDIDMRIEIDELSAIASQYDNIEQLLTSRKMVDRNLKNEIKSEIEDIQKRITRKILAKIRSGAFGKDFEGIVVTMKRGTSFKVINPSFRERKANET